MGGDPKPEAGKIAQENWSFGPLLVVSSQTAKQLLAGGGG